MFTHQIVSLRWSSIISQLQAWDCVAPLQFQEVCQGYQIFTGWQVRIPGPLRRDAIAKTAFRYIAVTHDSHVQVWRTPNHLIREFAPFTLHRTYTGHHDEVLSIEWSPDSK